MKLESKTFQHQEIQKEYDALYLTDPIKDEDRAYRWFAARVAEQLRPSARLLDLACGGGYFLREIAAGIPGALTCGLDLSGEALVLARKTHAASRYILGVGEHLPFRSQSFDFVSCLGSLEHFLNPLEALAEIKRVLIPSGQTLILVPNLFWYKDIASVMFRGQRLQRNQSHEMFAVESEWRELLGQGGFRVQRVIKYNGISQSPAKQALKDVLIPRSLSYHFVFLCRPAGPA